MPVAVVMPKLGLTMQEGTVIEWPFEIGAQVNKGDVVLIIESEKAEIEVEAGIGERKVEPQPFVESIFDVTA